jgi:ABC-2 type transport system ATP-binding protein
MIRSIKGTARGITPALHLQDLSKTYKVHQRKFGVRAALKSLVYRDYQVIQAVQDVTFDVAPGEVVGFLGPNGAGKTTTIKMLSGLLYPSHGEARVLDYDPWRRQREFLKRITLIMGRRNQLVWDVPAIDSFEFFRIIYGIPQADYKSMLDEMVALLELEPLLYKPVRNLSLGERMKCELAGALLHRPEVLFLDEPTIGLDVLAQYRFRRFLGEYNRRYGATILLTSHYMGDVEELCQRVVFIDQGRMLFDGSIVALAERFLPYKTLQLRTRGGADLSAYGEVISRVGDMITLRVPKKDTLKVLARLVADLPIEDLNVSDPPITEVVKHIYTLKEAALAIA